MTSYTQRAVELAIRGGWVDRIGSNHSDSGFWQVVTSDPLFWSVLGKGIGYPVSQDGDRAFGWQHQWHLFIDSLIAGKSPDDFFKDLLSNHSQI